MVGHSWVRGLTALTVLTGATQSQTDSALEGLPRQPRTDSKLRIFITLRYAFMHYLHDFPHLDFN